jgi:hypothetical protein
LSFVRTVWPQSSAARYALAKKKKDFDNLHRWAGVQVQIWLHQSQKRKLSSVAQIL